MSIWTRIGEFLASITSEALSSAVEAVRTFFEGDPVTRKQVAFSVAIIGLSAKMAKADGIVTPDEVNAFQELFKVPEHEAHHVAKLYNLAKEDVAGFEYYAAQVKRLFPNDNDILIDVIDGLFHIAKADGIVHELELEFVAVVAEIFGIEEHEFSRAKLRHVASEKGDPYIIMGAARDWTDEQLKTQHRKMIIENHPDKMIARGVPQEFLKIANDRLAKINIAWAAIVLERGL